MLARSASGVRTLVLTPLTYFEICEPCKAQNRDSRPWLESVTPQANITAKLRRPFFNSLDF